MSGTYNGWLVALSIAVAVLVSYTALKLASRIAESDQSSARLWLVGGATAMGFGIWAMHFIGMLALSLPITLLYDIPTTVASLLVAILSCGLAINIASRPQLGIRQLAPGGVVMGLGIATMHYLGMAAIEIVPMLHYRPELVLLSVLIAIAGACAALWLAFRLRHHQTPTAPLAQLAAAVLLGISISGMHYVGMAASMFDVGAYCSGGIALNSDWLAVTTALLAAGVLGVTLLTDIYSARMANTTRRHAQHLEQMNAQLQHQATHDVLTGLPNRQYFYECMGVALHDAHREGRRLATMVIDLDRFKLVNDSFGHPAGDELLREVGTRLNKVLRRADVVARIGGDEFLVLLNQVRQVSDAEAVAAKILEELARPMYLGSLDVRTSASIGISLFPEHGTNVGSLLARADEAMYHAKQRGGNGSQCFAMEMKSDAQQRLQLENELRQALQSQQFELHYQPRIDVHTGRIGSVEALIRWRHPTRGLLAPAAFLRVAEETGLIVPVGAWVLHEACRQAVLWQQSGLKLRVAVNLSAAQFRQPDLFETISDALSRNQLPPQRLELELTESAVMTDAETSVTILQQLSRMGIIIAVDNFGTGYSSVSYLRRLPIDRLKIDSSFVQGLGDSHHNTPIVQAIISLAHSLHIKVIAEGVESAAQLEQLKALGCDQWQGYLFGKPDTAKGLERQLRAGYTHVSVDDQTQTIARLLTI